MIEIEIPNQPTAPRLSDAALADYRRLLADQSFATDYPERYAALKSSVDQAMRETSQTFEEPPDGRTGPQQAHDRQFGISYGADGRVALPSELTTTIEREAAGDAADPKAIAAQLQSVGMEYKPTLEAAQYALDMAGSEVKATTLSAYVLANLNIYAGHLARHQKARPS